MGNINAGGENMFRQLILAFAMVPAVLHGAAAFAQDFPSHAIKIVVPWAPGGNVDITARTLQQALSEALGQPVIVDNRAGAGGTIGTAAVVKSPADGYTLLLGSSGTVTSGAAVFKNLSYNPLKDLLPVGPIQYVSMVLTAAPKTPVSNFKEYAAYAKSKPGQVSIASAGNGSSNHLALELMARQADLQLVHIPYKGSGPAINDLLGNQVESMMDQMTASIEHIRNGRIKALGVTSKARSPLLPNVATLDEQGLTGFEAGTFTGLFAPAGTPPAVLDKLHAALQKALANDTVRTRYQSMGVEIMHMSRPEFAAFVQTDYEKWVKIAREANIVIQ
jgi:tripartite-type tricarboxylate transporter receptor subunit TctC